MKKIKLAFLISLMLLPSVSFSVTLIEDMLVVEDVLNREVRLSKPAKRVITLAPHLTEIVFHLSAGDKIVGTIVPADFPEAAKKIPIVGDFQSLNIEKIIQFKPDLIIAWASGGQRISLEKLADFGLTVYYSEAKTFADIAHEMMMIGHLLGIDEAAVTQSNALLNQMNQLKKNYADMPKKTVFYQIGHDSLYTVNAEHFIGKMLDLCGGENVFGDALMPIPQVSMEAVIESNPSVIIYAESETSEANPSYYQRFWQKYPFLAAVKNDHVLPISTSLLSRPGPRLLEGVQKLCELLHSTH